MESSTVVLLLGLLWRCCLSYRYFYETSNMTWDEAQQNCRRLYTDLATFDDMEDIESLQRPPGMGPWHWIGLKDDPRAWKSKSNASTSWRWSSTGKTVHNGFSNWRGGEPNNYFGESCVVIDAYGNWNDDGCEVQRPSVCFNDSAGNNSYVYNPAFLPWSEAQAFCRQNHVDLAIIESAQDNTAVAQASPASGAWIGLFRIPFSWSDSSTGTFRNWVPLWPNNTHWNDHCAFETETHGWKDAPCEWKLPSICYKPDWETRKTTLRQTMRSSIDLSDSAVLQQILQQLEELVGEGRSDVALKLKIERVEQDKRPQPTCPPCVQ